MSISGGYFWDGTGGALIGAVMSASIAIYVLFRTRKYDRQLFLAQQNTDAARRITSVVNDLYNLARSLRVQSPYPGTEQMDAVHQMVQSVVSVTRLDIPLLDDRTMRVRIYHTRRRCEDAEEETKQVLKSVEREYERGLITEDEAYQVFMEADPLGPLVSHLAALVTDLDEFRALGKVPRRVTVNPPQSRDSITLFEWSQSKRPRSCTPDQQDCRGHDPSGPKSQMATKPPSAMATTPVGPRNTGSSCVGRHYGGRCPKAAHKDGADWSRAVEDQRPRCQRD